MTSYNEFKNMYLGKSVDIDHCYGAQCWDLASGAYMPYIGGWALHCGLTNYVKDIANQRNTNGILQFCTDIGLQAELQPGDICVWTNCPACPDSHIAIYDHDDGQNAVYFLGQRQPEAYVTVKRIPVSGIIGVFRPKIFEKGSGHKPMPDQILSVGSKVKSDTFYVQSIDYARDWMYNSKVGGWVPCADVDEVDSRDGCMDQIVHVGSGVQFNKGLMTVTGLEKSNGVWIAKCDKLDYWVLPDCLIEVEDGR